MNLLKKWGWFKMSGIWKQKYCPNCYNYVWRFINNWDNEEFCPYCNKLMKMLL